MDLSFPYARYACPCGGDPAAATPVLAKRASREISDVEPGDDQPFNPHDPRAAFSLYPIDHLLYCNECDQPRCHKCWWEEIIYWYCPSCQFEVPSSGVRSDGNRCARHCYDCPICAASLSTTMVKASSDNYLKPEDGSSSQESYILQCHACDWTSLDIGVKLKRPNKITEQLNKLWKERNSPAEKDGEDTKATEGIPLTHEGAFANLLTFYKGQLSDASDPTNPYSNTPYSSPANLARIMSLYGGLSYGALKKSREKPQPMREADGHAEGMTTFTALDASADHAVIRKMETLGLDALATSSQTLSAPKNYDARFTEELWPVATPLRTRRGKRCRTCRQILVRPEPKVGSMRYKIRLPAVNHLQRLSVRPLQSRGPVQSAAFHVRSDRPPPPPKLPPRQTHHFILTVRNPVFETVKVTLSTPAVTPGRVASRVTILCPSFSVGPAGDMWDEALSSSTSTSTSAGAPGDGGRRAAMESLTGSADADRQPEAGKIWERSRNSTSVVLEVVPGAVTSPPSIVPQADTELAGAERRAEDDDVLEIPIYVRAEWEADVYESNPLLAKDKKGERVSKELAYWCVLGIGRIAEA